jgi:hypothetical protein
MPLPAPASAPGSQPRAHSPRPLSPTHQVLLIDSPKHTERQVIKAITAVVPNSDEGHARNCYSTSKELGMAIVTTCLKVGGDAKRTRRRQTELARCLRRGVARAALRRTAPSDTLPPTPAPPLQEHAEHYAQQLYRKGCRAAIEPDASTI